MITYNDLYEMLRKEKFSESLQLLPKSFLLEFADYVKDKKEQNTQEENLLADSSFKTKKQLENSISLFKELILRRKKKLLTLVFVAAETGIMKRDYENMLAFEKEIFDKLVKAFEEGDRELLNLINGKKGDNDANKMIIFTDNVEQFVDMNGKLLGPYNTGQLVNLEGQVSDLFVTSGKARYIDE